MVLVNSENYRQYPLAPAKIFASRFLGRKKCKEYRFEGAPKYYSAQGAHVSLAGPDAVI